ncbi:MAG: hypothetical protein ABI401_16040 [Candidatus Dormibacter sp.]
MADRTVLDEAVTIRGGHLWIEACDTVELAERFGTPAFVVSEDQLRWNVRRIWSILDQVWGGPIQLLPSIKANFARRRTTHADRRYRRNFVRLRRAGIAGRAPGRRTR